MCGIFGYIGNKNSIIECLQGLKRLEYRGYDSSGIATIKNGKIIHFKACGKINVLEKKINLKELDLKTAIIGHTRWATHGPVFEKNAHPHFDQKYSLALVHNGIIENYDILKKNLLKKNIKFHSQTDTEVISHLIAYYYKNDIVKATLETLKKLKGSYAIALIHKNHPKEIIAAAKDSPLAIGFNNKKDEIILASDPNAFLGRNLNVMFLKDSELAHIKKGEIIVYDSANQIITKQIEKLNCKNSSYSKKGYEHFMLKEIFEQPQTIQKTFLGRIEKNSVEFENFFTKNFLSEIDHILITACGSAYHAGLIGSFFLQEKASIFTSCEIASEMRFKNLLLTKKTLVIAISQSGETADTISAIKAAKEKGCSILAIVNVENSTISRLADFCIFLKAGPEISVCSTKAFSSQITAMYLFAIYLARLKSLSKDEEICLLKELKKIPLRIKKVLKSSELIKLCAYKYAKYENFFFLGRDLMYPIAMEAALKLKEISYLNANAYPAGEMKHGPLALISSNLPVIAFCANTKTYGKLLSNLMETKARDAPILAFAAANSYGIADIADDIIWLDNTLDDLATLPSIVAGQLFAYFVAKKRKTDIDHPRNLAKSVTVE